MWWWLRPGWGCLERLWSLHPSRYSEAVCVWVFKSKLKRGWTRWLPEVPSVSFCDSGVKNFTKTCSPLFHINYREGIKITCLKSYISSKFAHSISADVRQSQSQVQKSTGRGWHGSKSVFSFCCLLKSSALSICFEFHVRFHSVFH